VTELRSDLPPLPDRIARLPVHRGFPVPWFVTWMQEDGTTPCARGEGTPEFRVITSGAIQEAVNRGLCWVCGQRLGAFKTFVAGPMCGVNRNSQEPPCHHECAVFSAIACPFLSKPQAKRRDGNLPEGGGFAGIGIERNPGVTMLWTTKKYSLKRDPKGELLINIGEPEKVEWIAKGREATREEIEESIDTGLPLLYEIADENDRESRAEARGGTVFDPRRSQRAQLEKAETVFRERFIPA